MIDAVAGWHGYLANGDAAALDALLADDVVFQSPAVHTPQIGKAVTTRYLRAAAEVLGGDQFRYVGEWRAARSAVIEFESEVGGLHVNGVDIIHWNAEGRIVRFRVMVRPLKALHVLVERMAETLARAV